jgi:hypothetical protein
LECAVALIEVVGKIENLLKVAFFVHFLLNLNHIALEAWQASPFCEVLNLCKGVLFL